MKMRGFTLLEMIITL
ncbi:prepilin-type N-terminal cleavage/methylation domain-containing protein, partial [Escherichia coli]|nr:prepilin-type N-terminal cleavage/methylation domain-containing protein [Escherichia coli]